MPFPHFFLINCHINALKIRRQFPLKARKRWNEKINSNQIVRMYANERRSWRPQIWWFCRATEWSLKVEYLSSAMIFVWNVCGFFDHGVTTSGHEIYKDENVKSFLLMLIDMTLTCNWESLLRKNHHRYLEYSLISIDCLKTDKTDYLQLIYLCTQSYVTQIGFLAVGNFFPYRLLAKKSIFNSRFLFPFRDGSRKQNWTRITMVREWQREIKWKNKDENHAIAMKLYVHILCQKCLTNGRHSKFIFISYEICVHAFFFGDFIDMIFSSRPWKRFLWNKIKNLKVGKFIEFLVVHIHCEVII